MKRAGSIWPRIVSFQNLCRAARRAGLGKRRVASVATFLADLEPEALALQRELRSDQWSPSRPTTFEIHDPKRRTITAAPFGDRVVHHALIDVLEPVFDRRMIDDSFACRRARGTHAALDHAQRLLRRHGWFLKMDVRKFFESLEHEVVMATLRRILKDRRVLRLCERIVHSGGAAGKGLPIGNLTSQWFANLVLDRLDHHVKEQLGVRGYVRYMDDFVLFGTSKAELASLHREVRHFLEVELHLALKERATTLAPATEGLPFLGWRLYRGTRRLRPENLRRTRARLRHRAWQLRKSMISEASYVSAVRAVCEHLRHGNTRSLRRVVFADSGETPGSVNEGTGPQRREPSPARRVLQQLREERAEALKDPPRRTRISAPSCSRNPSPGRVGVS